MAINAYRIRVSRRQVFYKRQSASLHRICGGAAARVHPYACSSRLICRRLCMFFLCQMARQRLYASMLMHGPDATMSNSCTAFVHGMLLDLI
jgi:hypothetical protein